MGFLTTLFGGTDNTVVTALIALGIVLVLIVLGVWALKAVFKASSGVGRGRNRRLNIVDAMPIDQRRQLVLIRRDNVEHLLMIGGGEDLVIESGIPAPAQPVAQPAQQRGRGRRQPPAKIEPARAQPIAAPPPPMPAVARQAAPPASPSRPLPQSPTIIRPSAPPEPSFAPVVANPPPAAAPSPAPAPIVVAPAPIPPAPTVAAPPRMPLAERFRAVAARPVPPANPETANWSPTDRLRELGRPGDRRSSSLRHTGLLRAVSRLEPMVPGNDQDGRQARPGDSDTSAPDGTEWGDVRGSGQSAGARRGDDE